MYSKEDTRRYACGSTLEVLDIDRLNTKVVKSKITEIRAEEGNMVIFCMDDGSEIVKRWKNRSRAESWTPEMKEQARQRALQARRKRNEQNSGTVGHSHSADH